MQAYLSFNGNAAEALAFYAHCLGGKLTSLSYGESPMANEVPAEAHGRVMHARLEARGLVLMGADNPPGMEHHGYHGFALSVQSGSVDEGARLFDALAAGGKVTMPYAATFWSQGFGMLLDRFGVPWMVNCEVPPAG
jgi:PhnB protein